MQSYGVVMAKKQFPPVLFGFIHPYFDGNGRLARFLISDFIERRSLVTR